MNIKQGHRKDTLLINIQPKAIVVNYCPVCTIPELGCPLLQYEINHIIYTAFNGGGVRGGMQRS